MEIRACDVMGEGVRQSSEKYMARCFVFYVLHGRYGWSYARLGRSWGMPEKSVMRCVRSVLHRVGVYPEWTQCYEALSGEIGFSDEK